MNHTHMQNSKARASFLSLRRALALGALLSLPALHAGEIMILGDPPSPTAVTAVHALEDESRRAVLGQDYATLGRLWSEQLVVNTPGNFVAPNRDAVFAIFRRGEGGMYSSFEKTIECIAFDGDLVIVMGGETVTPRAGPMIGRAVQRRYTNVWRFAEGTWILIARQATIPAPGAPTGPPASRPKS